MPGRRPFANSIIERGLGPTQIEEGRIFNVHMRRWTADVRTAVTQRAHLDIPWSNPYFHFTGGEGIFFMPEVGAKCMVCSPGDGTPFILCFVTAHENYESTEDDGSSATNGSTAEDEEEVRSNISYKSGRPNLQQGDIMIRTRDGNGVWFRRGGVVEVGSTAISKRLYIPLLNFIRDFCENYELSTGGGRLSWNVARSDENPNGEAAAVLQIMSRDMAQHEFGSVGVQIGHVDDTNRLKIVIAPQKVNPIDLSVEDGDVYTLEIDETGAMNSSLAADCTMEIGGNLSVTVSGSSTYTYEGDLTEDVTGNQKTTISGSHELEARSSKETMSVDKTIEAPSIKLGRNAVNHLVMAEPFLPWIFGHIHPTPAGPSGPPSAPPVNPTAIMTRKTTGE